MAIVVSLDANRIAERKSSMDYKDWPAEFEVIKKSVINKHTKIWESSTIEYIKRPEKRKTLI